MLAADTSSPVLDLFDKNDFTGVEEVYTGAMGESIGREKTLPRPVPTIKDISETERAFWYMSTTGATKYSRIDDFAGDEHMLREHMAKMLLQRGTSLSLEND